MTGQRLRDASFSFAFRCAPVPYRGSAKALADLLGGHVHAPSQKLEIPAATDAHNVVDLALRSGVGINIAAWI
jgi:hypothetical protein